MNTRRQDHDLLLVTGVSQIEVFRRRLMSSPCVKSGVTPLMAFFNCSSAAEAFNAAMNSQPSARWLVWLHQDIVLPESWETILTKALDEAVLQFPSMAVAGVYGVAGAGPTARHAGHILDRGSLLTGTINLPCEVDSLDELMFAVRVDSGLRLDPELKFDFYATDLVLQAKSRGLISVAVDAYCEHWSETPQQGPISQRTARRIAQSAAIFERKWAHAMPITTTCFAIEEPGDVLTALEQIGTSDNTY